MAVYHYIKPRVISAHCVDETSPESAGSDEIMIGGVAVYNTWSSKHKGFTKAISPVSLGDWDDGEAREFKNKVKVVGMSMWNHPRLEFPKTFGAILFLAERDGRGFDAFAHELREHLEKRLGPIYKMRQEANRFLWDHRGTFAGEGWRMDDISGAQSMEVTITSCEGFENGKRDTNDQVLTFGKPFKNAPFDGRYELVMDWLMYT